MDVRFYRMTSENNAINKTMTLSGTEDVVLKGDSSIYTPTLVLKYYAYLRLVNYVYIPDLHRYYFITNTRFMTGSRCEIDCRCDVLESFKTKILGLPVILDYTENTGKNMYLNGEPWIHNVKNTTSIIPFSNGLLDSGEYILITAGGIGAPSN